MNPANYTTISLFGLEMDLPRTLQIGSLSIHLYGIIIACGLLLAVIYGCKRCKHFGFSEDDLLDGVLFIVPFAILCARLYYCIFEWDSYKDNLISILHIWNGGLAIYGGVIGAAVGVLVFSKVKKIKVGAVLDIVAIGFLIGQAIGRWGNFFNREAFGAATESFMKMGLVYCDYISTVSETYAYEIQTPEYGYGMEGILRSRAHRILRLGWPKGSMEGGALWGWDREGCVQSGEAHLLFPSSPSPFTEGGPHASPSCASPPPPPAFNQCTSPGE